MYCCNCKKEIKDGSIFCTYCGVEQVSEKKEKKRKTGLIIVLVCLITLLLAGVLAIGFLKFYNDGELFGRDADTEEVDEEDQVEEEDQSEAEEDQEEEILIEEDSETTSEQVPEEDTQPQEGGKSVPFQKSCIESVTASSSLSEYDMTHSPDRLIDEDISTAWVEGVNGQGIGENVTFQFDDEYTISGLKINAGYQKSDSLYEKNSRPAELKISFSDGSSQTYTLQDINDGQEIVLEQPVMTDSISITIETVYPGRKYQDTAITEISIY